MTFNKYKAQLIINHIDFMCYRTELKPVKVLRKRTYSAADDRFIEYFNKKYLSNAIEYRKSKEEQSVLVALFFSCY